MRILKMDKGEWYVYSYALTERVGWHHCIFFAIAIFPMLENTEILTSKGLGEPFKMVDVEIKSEEDILKLKEEASALEIRGCNKVYDECPFQFRIFNQTDIVEMVIPEPYINSLKRNETELLTEEEKIHTFDKLMDHIEIKMHTLWEVSCVKSNMMVQIPEALCRKDNFIQQQIYRTNLVYNKIDLSEICNRIVENWKEVNFSKTGGPEAIAAAMNALKSAATPQKK